MKPEYALNRFMQFDSSAGRPTSVLLASLVRCDRAKRAAGWEPQFSHSACDFPSAGKRVIDVAAPRATVTDTSIARYQSDRVQLVAFLEMIVPFGTMTSQPVHRANYTCPDTDASDFSNAGVYLKDVATVAAFAAKNHRQSARSTVNPLDWPVNFLCKESENGSTNHQTTLVI